MATLHLYPLRHSPLHPAALSDCCRLLVLTLFALSNLWMARKQLIAMMGVVRPKAA